MESPRELGLSEETAARKAFMMTDRLRIAMSSLRRDVGIWARGRSVLA